MSDPGDSILNRPGEGALPYRGGTQAVDKISVDEFRVGYEDHGVRIYTLSAGQTLAARAMYVGDYRITSDPLTTA